MTFDRLLENRPQPVRDCATRLREITLKGIDKVEENIGGGTKVPMAFYNVTGAPAKMYCVIQPSDEYCLFYLHHFDKIDTGDLKLEGKGKKNRHVKFRHPDEINPEKITAILKEIGRHV